MAIGSAVFRLALAAAIASAVVGQFLTTLAYFDLLGFDDAPFRVVNFFSFFTISSNVAAVITLLLAVVFTWGQGKPQWLTVARACATTYMVTTGIVYNLLLRGIELPQGRTLDWANEVMHVWGPLLLVLDWIFGPGRHALDWRHIGTIVAFPVLWVAYTLMRAPFTFDPESGGAWYPYPFLNPDLSANGYLSVAFYVTLIAAIIGLVGAGVVRLSRRGLGVTNATASSDDQ